MTNEDTKKGSLKLFAVQAVGWGFGWGLGMAAVILSVMYFTHRPKGRDKNAFIAQRVKVQGLYDIPKGVDSKHTTSFFITVDLENRTGQDVTLPNDMTVMVLDKGTNALMTYDMTGPQAAFLPAHHVTGVTLNSGEFCPKDVDPRGSSAMDECFEKTLKHFDLLLFDPAGNYEIKIPIPDKLSDWNF
jgi:hypothetical protein